MPYTSDWWTQNEPTWRKYVLPLLQDRGPLEVMEIGAFEGRSTNWICDNILKEQGSYLTVIDTFKGSPEHEQMGISTKNLKERFLENTARNKNKMTVIIGRSQEILDEPGFSEPWYDLIYIDGSHMAGDVLRDAELSWRALKNGGVIVFDDYAWDAKLPENQKPKMAIDYFIHHTYMLKVIHLGYQAIIQKTKN